MRIFPTVRLTAVMVLGTTLLAPHATVHSQTQWHRSVSKDEVTDHLVLHLRLTAAIATRGTLGQDLRASLVVRCADGPQSGPEVYVDLQRVVDEEQLVLRWDQLPAETTYAWTRSTDHHALFADDPVEVLTRIGAHRKLLVRYAVVGRGGQQTTRFNLAGLQSYSRDLQRRCGVDLATLVSEYQRDLAEQRKSALTAEAEERRRRTVADSLWALQVKQVVLAARTPQDTTVGIDQTLEIRQFVTEVVLNSGRRRRAAVVGAAITVDGEARYYRVEGDTLRFDAPGLYLVGIVADGVEVEHTLRVRVPPPTEISR